MNRSRRIAAGIAGLVLVGAVVAFFAITFALRAPTLQAARAHPSLSASQTCISCKIPTHQYRHRVPYRGQCESCHELRSWRLVSFVHLNDAFNIGMHPVLGCARCHTEGAPLVKPDCVGCHASKHAGPRECVSCHSAAAWSLRAPLPVGHLALSGGHQGLSCFKCHSQTSFSAVPRTCSSCHGTKHGGLTACERCHAPQRGWSPVPGFNHDSFFRLAGRHARLACGKCHPANRFVGTPTTCAGCHGTKHGGLRNCSACHSTSGFVPSTFRHSRVFVLSGAHRALGCSRCHPGSAFARLRWSGSGVGCVRCHGARHGGLSNCSACHSTTSFKPSSFIHSRVFVLSGAHARLSCSRCHPSAAFAALRWSGTGTACVRCHGVKHGGQRDCKACHTTSAWSPIRRVTHPGTIRLGSAHASRSCRLCHPTVNFSASSRPCEECHVAPHVQPTHCINCHRPTVWSEVHFVHPSLSFHSDLGIDDRCADCHTTGNFAVYTCVRCHSDGRRYPGAP